MERLLFELSGWGVEVTVSLDEDGRVERLSYRSEGQTREFPGEEVLVADSEIGTLVTVVLESGASDLPPVSLTLVLPVVNPGGEGQFPVEAAAVRTTTRSLFGGPRPGPQHSYETITLEGSVFLGQVQGTERECHAWSARVALGREGGRALVVEATCTFPRAGYTVELRRHEPQGINPEDLLLDKVVQEPAGPSAEVITDVHVHYQEETDFDYRTVTILPDGPTIEVRSGGPNMEPALPIIQVGASHPRLDLLSTLEDAHRAAASSAGHRFFDGAGRPLRVVAADEGRPELTVEGEQPADQELRAELEAALEQARREATDDQRLLYAAGYESQEELSSDIDDLLASPTPDDLIASLRAAWRPDPDEVTDPGDRRRPRPRRRRRRGWMCKLFGTC